MHLVLTKIYVIARVVLHDRGNVYVNVTLKHVGVTVIALEEQ